MTFFTQQFVISIISSFIISMGFGVLLKINPRHLLWAGICGLLTYLAYYTVEYFEASLFAAAFVSAVVTALFAEIMARVLRAPAIIYLLTGVVPTVPGSDLYYTMKLLMMGNNADSLASLLKAISVGLGIAGGIVTVSMLSSLLLVAIKRIKKNRAKQITIRDKSNI